MHSNRMPDWLPASISSPSAPHGATGRMIAGEGIPGEPDTVPEIEQYIPERYNHASELRITLKPGENHHDLALSK